MLTTLLLTGVLDRAIVTPTPTPTGEPLSLDEVRRNLRVDTSDDDGLILGLIVAAREYVETTTGLVLTRRTVTETARELGRWIDLSAWPIVSVDAIRYPVGASYVDLPTGAWACSYARRPVRLLPALLGWGVARALTIPGLPVEIDVTAGYATPADVPMQVRQAMHLLVAHWYSNREAVKVAAAGVAVEVPMGVAELLRSFRLVSV